MVRLQNRIECTNRTVRANWNYKEKNSHSWPYNFLIILTMLFMMLLLLSDLIWAISEFRENLHKFTQAISELRENLHKQYVNFAVVSGFMVLYCSYYLKLKLIFFYFLRIRIIYLVYVYALICFIFVHLWSCHRGYFPFGKFGALKLNYTKYK